MKISTKTLENGVRVVSVPMPGTETVTVMVMVGTGSKYETKQTSGLSHFLEHMMFKGTTKRPSTVDISEALDRVGGIYNAFTGNEYTGYWAKVDASHFDVALDVISDMLLNSKFSAKEINQEKGVIIEEIKMYQDMPMAYVEILYEKLLYGNQPAGWPIIGTEKSVNSFKRADFINYYRNQYQGDNLVVLLAGKIGKVDTGNYFRSIPAGQSRPKPKVVESQTKPECLVDIKPTDQTQIMLGFRAYDLFHPDRYALSLLATILGGMMSSRMWISVRERQGLAYSVSTSADMTTDTGTLVTKAGVAHDKVEPAIKAILKQYRQIRQTGVKQAELNKAKDNIKGKLLIGMESSDAVATSLATQVILTKKTLTPRQIINRINKVTPGDIKRVAQDVFKNETLNLCMITDRKRKNIDRLLSL